MTYKEREFKERSSKCEMQNAEQSVYIFTLPSRKNKKNRECSEFGKNREVR